MKLNQVIAVEKGIKSRANAEKSELYKAAQKPGLFGGLNRRYTPRDAEGETLPPEGVKVQMIASDVLASVGRCIAQALDVEATKDFANCAARADVVVDGETLVERAPVTFLLNLEKELTDIHTFVATLPTLDPAEDWMQDPNSRLWKTQPTHAMRTKKQQKAIVLYPATPEHPAQTQLITEDETVGHWEQVRMSGALPESERRAILVRIEKLQVAVKCAREQANMIEAEDKSAGKDVIRWLLGEVNK